MTRSSTHKRHDLTSAPQKYTKRPSLEPIYDEGVLASRLPAPVCLQIKAAMGRRGLSVTDLAELMGRDHGQVSRAVSGTHVPGRDLLQAFADALGEELVHEVRVWPSGGVRSASRPPA